MMSGKGTTIKEALARWEEKNPECKAGESAAVQLYFQVPPIEKMDASLSTLTKCEKLSLSTNCIEKINNLNGLKNLRILSLGRNNIKSLTGLEVVGDTVQELWISYNLIEKLKGIAVLKKLRILYMSNNLVKDWNEFHKLEAVGDTLQELWISYNVIEKLKGINVLKKLVTLYMSNNLVKDWGEFGKLVDLPCLEDILFVGNPLEEKHSQDGDWRDLVSNKLKKLRKLDGVPVIRQEVEDDD